MKLFRTLTLLLSFFTLATAYGSAPMLKTQAPGFYRMMVGDYEVTALLDGFFPIKPSELLDPPLGDKLHPMLARSYQGDEVITSVNGFLVNTGSHLILIDAGCGQFFGPSVGHLVENLKAAGYSPEQVDEIEITHMHADHLGGIVKDGKAVFPHATVHVDQRDADYWLNPENAKNVKPLLNNMFPWAVTAVAPYKALGQFKPFNGKTELIPGITALPTYGHTPGHTVYAIESQGRKLLLVGDLFHVEAIQFPMPSESMAYDSDTKTSAAHRKRIFSEAAKEGYLIGAAHLPFPGIGHSVAERTGFRYLPIPYGPVN